MVLRSFARKMLWREGLRCQLMLFWGVRSRRHGSYSECGQRPSTGEARFSTYTPMVPQGYRTRIIGALRLLCPGSAELKRTCHISYLIQHFWCLLYSSGGPHAAVMSCTNIQLLPRHAHQPGEQQRVVADHPLPGPCQVVQTAQVWMEDITMWVGVPRVAATSQLLPSFLQHVLSLKNPNQDLCEQLHLSVSNGAENNTCFP